MKWHPDRLAFLALALGIVLLAAAGARTLQRAAVPGAAHPRPAAVRPPLPDRTPRPLVDPAWAAGLIEAWQRSGARLVTLNPEGGRAGAGAIYCGSPEALAATLGHLEAAGLPLERAWFGPSSRDSTAGLELRVEIGRRHRPGR